MQAVEKCVVWRNEGLTKNERKMCGGAIAEGLLMHWCSCADIKSTHIPRKLANVIL